MTGVVWIPIVAVFFVDLGSFGELHDDRGPYRSEAECIRRLNHIVESTQRSTTPIMIIRADCFEMEIRP